VRHDEVRNFLDPAALQIGLYALPRGTGIQWNGPEAQQLALAARMCSQSPNPSFGHRTATTQLLAGQKLQEDSGVLPAKQADWQGVRLEMSNVLHSQARRVHQRF